MQLIKPLNILWWRMVAVFNSEIHAYCFLFEGTVIISRSHTFFTGFKSRKRSGDSIFSAPFIQEILKSSICRVNECWNIEKCQTFAS